MNHEEPKASRRDLLKVAACAAIAELPVASLAMTALEPTPSFLTLLRAPDLIRAFGADDQEIKLEKKSDGRWEGNGTVIEAIVHSDHVALTYRRESTNRSQGLVSHIQCRWRGDMQSVKRLMGDHWERSYADLEWRGIAADRTMPWYFMAFDGKHTHGYGVRTHPKAFCFWNADPEGISLWSDVRSGGVPVELGDRTLEVAQIVCRQGKGGESPFQATQAFCKQMCLAPRLPSKPTYGTNDWNYAYGNNSADLIANVSSLISELSTDTNNRPISLIDEGWAEGPYNNRFGYGPWVGNPRFGDMGEFAHRLKGLGVRPGIWFRPLTHLPDSPESWRLSREKNFLDPTIPDVLGHVSKHIKRFVEWGYEMVKHDFSTFDIMGMWGSQMGPSPTRNGWKFNDSSKTNAEVITELYRTIREAAGNAALIGCNTVSHLAVGFHELQRTGDDTSGRSWNRNRRMGVNTLAFRAPQHRSFYEVDPDIVSITTSIPWPLVNQWLRLVSESGVALFVAIDPNIVEPKHREALRKALAIAAKPQTVGEPLDWMDNNCPRHWKLLGKKVEFDWMGEVGAWPFGD